MARRRLTFKAAAISAAMALAAAFAGCGNPDDLMSVAKDDVKAAKDLFLVVKSVTPSANASDVNPNASIVIDFDRPVDPATITTDNVKLAPSTDPTATETIRLSYDATLRRLTIKPLVLSGGITYVVTLGAGLRGADGESLQAEYTWSFNTAALPGGFILINNDAVYSTSLTVTLTITPNNLVNQFRAADSAAALSGMPWDYLPAGFPKSVSVTISAGEGARSIYYQFLAASGATSEVLSDSIIIDTVPPNPPIAYPPAALNVRTPTWTWAAGTGDGIRVFQYSFDNPSAWCAETAVTAAGMAMSDGSHSIYVRERDAAGNWSDAGHTSATVNAPPETPTVMGTNETVETFFSATWTANGYGNGTFRYQIDSGSWSSTTAATSLTSGTLADGEHVLNVQERDAGGEWSASGTRTFTLNPYLPLPDKTGVSTSPIFRWRQPGAATFIVQLRDGKFWTTIGTVIESDYFAYTGTLAQNTPYTWRVYYVISGTTYYITPSSGATFTTRGRFKEF